MLDFPGDNIRGSEFTSVVKAYVDTLAVSIESVTVDSAPGEHASWVALPIELGKARDAGAVLWFEDTGKNGQVLLVLLELGSPAVYKLPVKLRNRTGAQMYRVLAASTRMVLDVAHIGDPGAAKKGVSQSDSASTVVKSDRRAERLAKRDVFRLRLGYLADLGLEAPTLLQGGQLGTEVLFYNARVGILADVGYVSEISQEIADLEVRHQRMPVRLGFSGIFPAGSTEISFLLFWSLEAVWLDAEVVGEEIGGTLGAMREFDTGGGVELRWRFAITPYWGMYIGVSGRYMTLSHSYERQLETVVSSDDIKLGWSVGCELF